MLLPEELMISEANLIDGLVDLLDMSRTLSASEDADGVYYRISYNYRLLGLCALLKDADCDLFQESLCKSAHARLFFLIHVNGESHVNAPTVCSSKNFPFFDSLAISNFELAREVALHSRTSSMEGYEYEEDFLFQHFLHRYVSGDRPLELESILNRLSSLEPDDSERVSLCQSILERDAELFDKAITRRIELRDEKFRKLRQEQSLHPDLLRTESFIFVEGMALVQLADHAGMVVQKDYKYIPGFARARHSSFPPRDAWRIPPGVS